MSATPLSLLLALPAPGLQEPVSQLHDIWQEAGIETRFLVLEHAHSDAVALSTFRSMMEKHQPNFIGGFSRGARIAAQATDARTQGLLCLGYPFHLHKDPASRPGLLVLRRLQTPTLIVQGSRDPHGTQSQVRGYAPLPDCVHMHWIEGGNHRFQLRKSATDSDDMSVQQAAQHTVEFIKNLQ